jgi:hypothetical protein
MAPSTSNLASERVLPPFFMPMSMSSSRFAWIARARRLQHRARAARRSSRAARAALGDRVLARSVLGEHRHEEPAVVARVAQLRALRRAVERRHAPVEQRRQPRALGAHLRRRATRPSGTAPPRAAPRRCSCSTSRGTRTRARAASRALRPVGGARDQRADALPVEPEGLRARPREEHRRALGERLEVLERTSLRVLRERRGTPRRRAPSSAPLRHRASASAPLPLALAHRVARGVVAGVVEEHQHPPLPSPKRSSPRRAKPSRRRSALLVEHRRRCVTLRSCSSQMVWYGPQ